MTGTDEQERRARRAARRETRQARFDTTVPSPCISVCQMDSDNRYCLGCRRSIDEIREWPILSAEDKRVILSLLPGRR